MGLAINKAVTKRVVQILAAPETNLFLFAFLLNFIYEVWESPYFVFYNMPTLLDKVKYITHCTVGDGILTLISGWVVSRSCHSRYWLLNPTWKLIMFFTGLSWFMTFIIEIYNVRFAKFYGVSALIVPVVGISWLPLLQWIILPPLVLHLARHQILGLSK